MNDGVSAPEVVYLHIGAMKTGTSYVQGNLDNSRTALADAGVLYPGRIGAAVHDVLGKRGGRHLGDKSGAWDRLAATVRDWDGPSAVLSMEFLTLATTAQAERIVESLHPAEVHVLLTARDLGRTIPSAWQQTTKNRQTASWPEFLVAITGADETGERTREQFWRHHDSATIARTWCGVVGADCLTVLTVPPRGTEPTVLWDRFCTAVGLDSVRFPVAESNAWNSSLGFAEAEMMRRLNLELGRDLDQPTYRRLVTEFISGDVLRGAAEPTPPPTLPAVVHPWVDQRARELVAELRALGIKVVGDLDELIPTGVDPDQRAAAGTEADPADVAAVAVRAVAALVGRLAEVTASEPEADGVPASGAVDGRPGGGQATTEPDREPAARLGTNRIGDPVRRSERRARRRAARAASPSENG